MKYIRQVAKHAVVLATEVITKMQHVQQLPTITAHNVLSGNGMDGFNFCKLVTIVIQGDIPIQQPVLVAKFALLMGNTKTK
jgi:hypothetical protein